MKNYLMISVIAFCSLVSSCQEGTSNCGYYPSARLSFVLRYNNGNVTSQLFSANDGTGSQLGYHVDSVRLTGNSGQVLPMDAEYEVERGEWVFSTERFLEKDGDFGGSGDGLILQRLILKLINNRQDSLVFTYQKRENKRSDFPCPPQEFGSASYFFNGNWISDELSFWPFLELEITN